MRLYIGLAAAAAALVLTTAPTSQAATLKADYRLENTLTSSVGSAPALTAAPAHPCTGNGPNSFSTATFGSRKVPIVDFQQDGGLIGPAAGVIPSGSYSIVVLFQFSSAHDGAWRRVIDLSGGTSDVGLYVHPSDVLDFYPTALVGTTLFTNDTWHQVVVTRNASTNVVSAYLDGTPNGTFTDTSSIALATANTTFFQDNLTGGSVCESPDGSAARIRLYNGALSPSAVAALDQLPPVQTAAPSPSGGAAGSATTLTGANFGPAERVTIKFTDGATTTTLGRVKTTKAGGFSTSVSIPAGAATGSATITVTGKTSGLSAKTTFTVTS